MNMDFIRKLPIPLELKTEMPLGAEAAKIKAERDLELRSICLRGFGKISSDNRAVLCG